MNIANFNSLKDIKQLYQLWNREYEKIYPISPELFNRNLENAYLDSCFYATDKDEIVGFIIGKIYQDKYTIESYTDSAWISLIYVRPDYRKQGIGSLLLLKAEEVFKKLGKTVCNLGRDCHNYFPGLPCDFANFVSWFEKRGFVFNRQTYDLIRETKNYRKLKIENDDFTFRIGNITDKEKIINFISRVWPGRWTQEALEYFNAGGTGKEYMLVLNKNQEVIGFAKVCGPKTETSHMSFSLTWRARFSNLGGIGPLGIDPNYRKKHLGYDIVSSAVNHLIDEGAEQIIVDWTGLLEFYRHMGFEVWKSYFYSSKKI